MPIHIDRSYGSGTFARPSDDIDPLLKKETAFNLAMAKYVYSQYVLNNTMFPTSWPGEVDRVRSYAFGKQSTDKYKKQLLDLDTNESSGPDIPSAASAGSTMGPGKQDDDMREGFMNVDFSEVFSPLPKYVMKLLGMFMDMDVDIAINAIDQYSSSMRDDMRISAEVDMEHGDWKNSVWERLGVPKQQDESFKPRNPSEMELFAAMGGFKLPYEIGLERALDHTFKQSDFANLLKECILFDLFTLGHSCVMDELDPYDKVVRGKYVDVRDLIIDTYKKGGSAPSFAAIPVDYTIEDLRAESGLMEEDLHEVAVQYNNLYGNGITVLDSIAAVNAVGKSNYDGMHVPVLKVSYTSTDTSYFTTRRTKTGRDVTFYEPYGQGKPRVYNTDKRKTNSVCIKRVYECYWIIGTEYVFNHGPVSMQPFDFHSKDVAIPFHLKSLPTKAPFMSAIPIEDQISLAFYRLQNGIATSRPDGMAIEMGALENVELAGRKITSRDLIRMLSQTGNVIWKQHTPMPGEGSVPMPIQELKGGIGSVILDAIRTMDFCYSQLSEMMGIDRISAVSKTPVAETGLGVMEMAQQATQDTTKLIFTNYARIKESFSTNAVLRIMSVLYSDKSNKSVYYNILGLEAATALKEMSTKRPMELGVSFTARPTEAEKMDLRRAAEIALQNGKNGSPSITYAEYFFIINRLNNGMNLKFVQAFLAYREGKKEEADRIVAQETQKMQAEMNQAQEQKKMETELAKIDATNKGKLAAIQLEKDLELRNEEQFHGFKMKQIEKTGEVSAKTEEKPENEKTSPEEPEPEEQPIPEGQQSIEPVQIPPELMGGMQGGEMPQ